MYQMKSLMSHYAEFSKYQGSGVGEGPGDPRSGLARPGFSGSEQVLGLIFENSGIPAIPEFFRIDSILTL